MKLTVNRSEFSEAISKLQKVVGSKTTMPVLEGILISAEKGNITMISYNLETGLKKNIYALVEEEGDIVINARLLSDIVRKLSGEQIEIESNEKLMCKISSNETVFEIMGMAASDFPEMPSVSDGKKINLEGKILSFMIKNTIFAVAQNEGTRPILTGINISVENGVLQFVGIDGYRLAIRREKVNINENTEFIAFGKAINEVSKLIEENTEEVEITVGERLISFNIDGYIFISRIMEGEFVSYKKIIPEEYVQEVVFNTSELINSIERVSLLINDSFTIPVRCEFEETELKLSCATAVGRAKENIKIDLAGTPFQIGINSRYFLDALRACDSEKIKIKFNGANSGVLIIPEDKNNEDFIYLVMPMRLK